MTNTIELMIWDRSFLLRIEYDCYDDEKITVAQENAVKQFLSHGEFITRAKAQVEEFCREQVQADVDNNKKDNIFSYIKPIYLFVKREAQPRVAIMCNYKYDLEHGVAIVFTADGTISVGTQDIIL